MILVVRLSRFAKEVSAIKILVQLHLHFQVFLLRFFPDNFHLVMHQYRFV